MKEILFVPIIYFVFISRDGGGEIKDEEVREGKKEDQIQKTKTQPKKQTKNKKQKTNLN